MWYNNIIGEIAQVYDVTLHCIRQWGIDRNKGETIFLSMGKEQNEQ